MPDGAASKLSCAVVVVSSRCLTLLSCHFAILIRLPNVCIPMYPPTFESYRRACIGHPLQSCFIYGHFLIHMIITELSARCEI